MRGARSPPPGYGGSPGPYDRRPSPAEAFGGAAYGRQVSDDPSNNYSIPTTYASTNPSMPSLNGGYDAYTPDSAPLPRAESPPPLPGTEPATIGGRPIGNQAIEMDATPVDPYRQQNDYSQIRDNDSDVAGMVNLQQGQMPNQQMPNQQHAYVNDEGSYNEHE